MDLAYQIKVEVMPIGTRVAVYQSDCLLHTEPIDDVADAAPAIERAAAWLVAREFCVVVQLPIPCLN